MGCGGQLVSKGVPKGESYNLVRERLSIQLYTGKRGAKKSRQQKNIFGIIIKCNSFWKWVEWPTSKIFNQSFLAYLRPRVKSRPNLFRIRFSPQLIFLVHCTSTRCNGEVQIAQYLWRCFHAVVISAARPTPKKESISEWLNKAFLFLLLLLETAERLHRDLNFNFPPNSEFRHFVHFWKFEESSFTFQFWMLPVYYYFS